MDEDRKRVNIEDLPNAAEELTDQEAKEVQGGAKELTGTLILNSTSGGTSSPTGGVRVAVGDLDGAVSNTVGGSLSGGTTDPTRG